MPFKKAIPIAQSFLSEKKKQRQLFGFLENLGAKDCEFQKVRTVGEPEHFEVRFKCQKKEKDTKVQLIMRDNGDFDLF